MKHALAQIAFKCACLVMNSTFVLHHSAGRAVRRTAHCARVRSFVRVTAVVCDECGALLETQFALITFEWTFIRVHAHVIRQIAFIVVALRAYFAHVSVNFFVHFRDVSSKARLWESHLTKRARVRSFASVHTNVR